MALNTFSFGDMTVPSNDIDMAPFTGNPSCNIFPMIETPSFDFNVSLGFDMARGTTSYGTRNALFLPFRASLIVVTDKTVDFMNGEVGSLNELGVAGGASQFNPPP
jgi:hypothetical protein